MTFSASTGPRAATAMTTPDRGLPSSPLPIATNTALHGAERSRLAAISGERPACENSRSRTPLASIGSGIAWPPAWCRSRASCRTTRSRSFPADGFAPPPPGSARRPDRMARPRPVAAQAAPGPRQETRLEGLGRTGRQRAAATRPRRDARCARSTSAPPTHPRPAPFSPRSFASSANSRRAASCGRPVTLLPSSAMRAPHALLLLLLAVPVGGSGGCGASTPVDINFGTDAGAGFDAPMREVHPGDSGGGAGAGGRMTDSGGDGVGGESGAGGSTSAAGARRHALVPAGPLATPAERRTPRRERDPRRSGQSRCSSPKTLRKTGEEPDAGRLQQLPAQLRRT